MTGQPPEPQDDLTIPPVHGRAGHGVASILPHLKRQKLARVSDFPPSEFPGEPDWSVLGGLDDGAAPPKR